MHWRLDDNTGADLNAENQCEHGADGSRTAVDRAAPSLAHTGVTGHISDAFEEQFLAIPFDCQVAQCRRSEFAPIFEQWLGPNQPILEAGCGSGKWVAWFVSQGWRAVGLDWSEKLCTQASGNVPGARFVPGDIRAMPFADAEFGAVVALGSIEHAPEGPAPALRELRRVLKPGGVAIVTVPYFGPVRLISRILRAPARRARASPALRRLLGKHGYAGRTLRQARQDCSGPWAADFACSSYGWHFYQYQFTRTQLTELLTAAGFEILHRAVALKHPGLINSFGRVAGRYSRDEGTVKLSAAGTLLDAMFPVDLVGHMLCCIARRRPS
jgi:SAM-dependent methyltransferase